MIANFFNENLEYQENLVSETCIKQGHDVVFVTSTIESVFDFLSDKYDPAAPARSYVAKGIKVIRRPFRWNFLNKIRRFPSLGPILEEERPDLIYAHDVTLNFPDAIRYLKKNPSCRMIMDCHADLTNSGKNWLSRTVLHGAVRRHYLNRARPHLSKIFPVTPGSRDFLRDLYGVRDDEMELLPLAIDLQTARRIRSARQGREIRAKFAIPDDAFVIFSGGKFNPLKRTELAIEAIGKLSNVPAHLIVVGEGEKNYPDYTARIKELGAAVANVHFAGWQDRDGVFKCLDASDIAVFPASQSVLWQQAIGMGLPLIVGDLGGQDPSYLNEHGNVVILPAEDITADRIATEIARLAADPNLRQQMREGADRVADSILDWNKVVLKTLRFNQGQPAP